MTPVQLAAHLSPPSTTATPTAESASSSPRPSDADASEEPIQGHPVVLPDLTKQWPEITPESLRSVLGESAVEVELGRRGRGYLDPAWQRVEMPFCEPPL